MPAKFSIYKDKKGEFRFRLKAANGETIATGESYPDKKSALKGIASIAKNAPIAKIEDTTIEEAAAKKTTATKTAAKTTAKPKAAAKTTTAKTTTGKPRGRKPKSIE
jgi:uncharacterized protein YegP (UPF0339 family)